MQRPAFVYPKLQSVCEFCAARHQSPATVIRHLPQRRCFQSSRKVYKPPAIAVAEKGEDGPLSASENDSYLGGGRENSPFSSHLSPEELKIREALQRRTPRPPPPPPALSQAQSDPPSHYRTTIRKTYSLSKDQPYRHHIRDSGIRAQWKNFRDREGRTTQNNEDVAFKAIRPTRSVASEYADNDRSTAEWARMEESRQARLEQTRDGKYVPLGARTTWDSTYSGSRALNSNASEQSHGSGIRSRTEKEPVSEPYEARELRLNDNSVGRFKSYPEKRSSRPNNAYSSSPYAGSSRERSRKKGRSSKFDADNDNLRGERPKQKRQSENEKATRRYKGPPIPIYLPEFITVSNLATALKVKIEAFGKRMLALGFEGTNNDHILDAETAGLIAAEFNFEPIVDTGESDDLLPRPPAEDVSSLPARPPVVTIMGHVDHGKTTLLDWLRKSSVAASEHGGITQHIGAFSVSMPGGRLITFLDTPGHAAFLSMRKRGANVTDVVILVVAADDSVKPQTIEAINHAQAAKVPMIVAVNKIDKEDANAERVKHDVARHGVQIEDFGGETQVVCVSGKTGQGMAELEDAAIALADVLDMRAETDGQAEGWVLEATTKKVGRIATVLVRRGTIRPGDVIVAGSTWAKVRCLRNEAGVQIPSAGPGMPAEIDGWKEQPEAGDEVLQAPDEQKAKSVIKYRIEAKERDQMAKDMIAINEARRLEQEKRELEKEKEKEQQADGEETTVAPPQVSETSQPVIKKVIFIIKADVSGSAEAVLDYVSPLGNAEVRPQILRCGVGPVTEFDIEHAASAKGHIISFNTVVEPQMARMAESAGVKILNQNIIYRLVDDVKNMLSEQLPPSVTKKVVGEAEIAQVFEINIKGRTFVPVAGCKIRNGVVSRNAKVRILRGQDVIHEGTVSSLKNVKKDVAEMRKGTECGMSFGSWAEFRDGDLVQCYEEKTEKRFL